MVSYITAVTTGRSLSSKLAICDFFRQNKRIVKIELTNWTFLIVFYLVQRLLSLPATIIIIQIRNNLRLLKNIYFMTNWHLRWALAHLKYF